jgi:hypothetical protein
LFSGLGRKNEVDESGHVDFVMCNRRRRRKKKKETEDWEKE